MRKTGIPKSLLGGNLGDTIRYKVGSVLGASIGVTNPVEDDEHAVLCLPPGYFSLPDIDDEVVHNGDDRDPIIHGVAQDETELIQGEIKMIRENMELHIDGNNDIIKLSSTNTGTNVKIDGVNKTVDLESETTGTKFSIDGVARTAEIVDPTAGTSIKLDAGNEKVTITPKTGSTKIEIDGTGRISLERDGFNFIQILSDGTINIQSLANVNIDGSNIVFNGGGAGVARIGDPVSVNVVGGSSAGTHSGTITGGSGTVKA